MYRYTVREEDVKATFSWAYTALDCIIVASIIGLNVTGHKINSIPIVAVFALLLCAYFVFAVVRVRMDALTPGMEYLVYQTKFGVVFRMISKTDHADKDLEVKLFVPFLRIKKCYAHRAFNLYALTVYVTEDDEENGSTER